MSVARIIEDMVGVRSRALRIIDKHPAVSSVTDPIVNGETGVWQIDVTLMIGLPNAWIADGQSPNGVKAQETVTLVFPAAFPLKAPTIYLRQDFDRTLAHVQPGSPDMRPVPCIVYGSVDELLQQQGLAGILNQLVLWLDHAALGQLIDLKQGWEPMRRDSLDDYIVADAAALRGLVGRDATHSTFPFEYFEWKRGDGVIELHGEIGAHALKVNPGNISEIFKGTAHKGNRLGESLAIVVTPGKHPSGELIVADHYQPETLVDLGGLKARGRDYGCGDALDTALAWLERCVSGYEVQRPQPIVIVLAARRPVPLISTDSEIELLCYVAELGAPKLFPAGDKTPVRPAGHRHAISATLLRAMSGTADDAARLEWVQLGCGSLGSKISLHLARSGRAPSLTVDRSTLSPHNAARHALVPVGGSMGLKWMKSKASALAEAIAGLGQTVDAVDQNVVPITAAKAKAALPRRAWAVVNSTASLAVREALGSVQSNIQIPRVIETTLFAAGRLGIVTIEGPARSPNTLDLMAETYSLIREDTLLRAAMFEPKDGLVRQVIGDGCGSATMVMTDARVSMFAAPIAEIVGSLQRGGMPDPGGRILIGQIAPDELSLTWSAHDIPPVTTVTVDGDGSWSVRISGRAAAKMLQEVRHWSTVETGGILVGRISEAARTFYVVDVLPAPEDSTRSAHEFVLGTKGARYMIADYAESTGYSLFCLGTWHSHLQPSGPSALDRTTAATVGLARLAPSILLIHTPAGFQAVLADTLRGPSDIEGLQP